jgi:hypothetical protein
MPGFHPARYFDAESFQKSVASKRQIWGLDAEEGARSCAKNDGRRGWEAVRDRGDGAAAIRVEVKSGRAAGSVMSGGVPRKPTRLSA